MCTSPRAYQALDSEMPHHERPVEDRALRGALTRYWSHEKGHGAAAAISRDKWGGGKRLRLSVIFPSCWDGRRLDSKDHMRHVACPTGKGCPKRHPVALPRLAIIAQFEVQDAVGYRLSSGSPGTAHGDSGTRGIRRP